MASAENNKSNFDQTALANPDILRAFPLTEPSVVTSLHADGFTMHAEFGTVRFAGWQTIEPLSEGVGERRIILRFAMSEFEARAFRFALGRALGEGH